MRHETVVVGDFERHLIRLLDGAKDKAALVPMLVDLVAKGELVIEEDGQALRDGKRVRELVGQALDRQLALLARNAILVK